MASDSIPPPVVPNSTLRVECSRRREEEQRRFSAYVCVTCFVGMIVLVGVSALGLFSDKQDKPVVPTVVVSGIIDKYETSGRSVTIWMKDQQGPHRAWNREEGTFDHNSGVWNLACKTVPSFVRGQRYTFTYRGSELLSCYKD